MAESDTSVRDKTEMAVVHKNRMLFFNKDAEGPNNYVHVERALEYDGLVPPTMAQTASLCYVASQNPDDPKFREVIDRLEKDWLWQFNGMLFSPNEGVYIEDNPNVREGKVLLKKSDLIKKITSGDKKVRFVPFGFKTGVQTPSKFANNPFVIGLAGEEGAEKLAKLSERYKHHPALVWMPNDVKEEEIRVSSLGIATSPSLKVGLNIVDSCGKGKEGYAFGIRKY